MALYTSGFEWKQKSAARPAIYRRSVTSLVHRDGGESGNENLNFILRHASQGGGST